MWWIKFCVHSWASKKKKSVVLFLFDAFDLSHLSVEHCITSDNYQGIHAARYHTIHIYCGLSHSAVAEAAASGNTTLCFQML